LKVASCIVKNGDLKLQQVLALMGCRKKKKADRHETKKRNG